MNKEKLQEILREMEDKNDTNNPDLNLELKWYLLRILMAILENDNKSKLQNL